MQLQNLTITRVLKGRFDKESRDGLCHVKQLPCLSVVQATEGYYTFGIDGQPPRDVPEGGFFVADAMKRQEIVHHDHPTTGRMTARWLIIDLVVNDVQKFDTVYAMAPYPDAATSARLAPLFEEIFSTDDLCDIYSITYRILKILLETATEVYSRRAVTTRALDFIHSHFSEKILAADVAEACHMSVSRLYSIFGEDMGISPMAYLNDYRLSQACFMLENTEDSITRIAEACGFSCGFYFSKAFKKRYGFAPTSVKKERRLR